MKTHNEEEALIYSALSQIKTPAYDMEGAVRAALGARAPRRRPVPRAALLAAALVAALAVGAAAVSVSGLWERFFPNPVPSSAVTTVGVSQTAGDYTLTLEDAMVDDNGAILLLSLRRTDGGNMDPAARLSSNSMHVRLFGGDLKEVGGGFNRPPIVSHDGKSLLFCFEARNHRFSDLVGLSGKSLLLTIDGVAIPLSSPGAVGVVPDEAIGLSPLAGTEIPDLSALEHWGREEESRAQVAAALGAQNLSLPLPLEEDFPQYKVQGAVTLEEGLAIAITQGRGVRGDRVCTDVMPEALVDTRDGSRYDMLEGTGLKFAGGTDVMLFTFRNCPLTAEDLPYLELEVCYALDQILSEDSFSFTFTADSGAAMVLPLDGAVNTPLHPSELRLSALGVILYFNESMDAIFNSIYPTKISPVITLKDGTIISTVWQGGSGGPERCNVAFQAQDENGERLFLDTAQAASVSLNGVTLWTVGSYILTLEDAMADDDGVILLLALSRADGGEVDPDARLRSNTISASLLADGERISNGFQPSVLSGDGRTLYLCVEGRESRDVESFIGKTLTFRAGGVGIPVTASETFPSHDMTVDAFQPLPLSQEFPSSRLVGIEQTEDGLAVTVSQGRDEYGGYVSTGASAIQITDIRDATTYSSTVSNYPVLPDGTRARRSLFQNCPLTEADFPSLQITYGYTMDKVLSTQALAFSFTLSGGSGHMVSLDQAVAVPGFAIRLTELRFSSIGLSLTITGGTDACIALITDGAEPILTLMDGSAVYTSFRQSGSNPDGPSSLSFQYADSAGNRVFPDTSQIAAISVAGQTIWQSR